MRKARVAKRAGRKKETKIPEKLDYHQIERKWQKKWANSKIFEVKVDNKKKKYYVLEMYPYPSASFLHMGHVRNYTIGDVYARFKRMQGFNVLYPMGYDSFGLPAETAAKKEGTHPKKYTEMAIRKIVEYQKDLGNSYDWSKVIASHDPNYYKWDQYFFLKLYENGMAYKKVAPVNWCENCQSVLANEEAEGGRCWRCEGEVVKKYMEQWFLKITEYADRLLDDLDKIQWPERIKTMQRNWIGKSHGVEILFPLENSDKVLPTFTTRCDTIFSVTFLAIAPESPIVEELANGTEHEKEVKEFVKKVMKEKIEDRINEEKEKEGIFTGRYAINPATREKIPIYVSNFAVMYGTGVVMCNAHDKRDFRFARKYNIPLKFVISKDGKPIDPKDFNEAYVDDGTLFNSGQFSGMNIREALPKMADWLEKNSMGKKIVNYKIKDWMISRQRYWGTPIPIIYCDRCGTVPVPEKDLPVLLPERVDFKSTANPLAANKKFLNVKCPKCGGRGRRETDTMGGFVDSSWYFLRYCDNKNKEKPFDDAKVNYWMPVDQYIGGAEHAVMHLIYARFFVKALKDLGFVRFDEPFTRLFNQGIVYKDGAKMSKSKGNVVYQTDISKKYGIDTARLFLMSVASPDKQMEWSEKGIEGSSRIINRLTRLGGRINKISKSKSGKHKQEDKRQDSKISIAIKKVTEGIEKFEYPKAISAVMECVNAFGEGISKGNYEILLKLISPFCPHTAEEMWERLGNKGYISLAKWPVADESKIDKKFEEQEKAVEKLLEDINNIARIVKENQNREAKKVYVYVLPQELEYYKEGFELVKNKVSLEVQFFAVNDKKKHDPLDNAKRAKFGRPAIYLE